MRSLRNATNFAWQVYEGIGVLFIVRESQVSSQDRTSHPLGLGKA